MSTADDIVLDPNVYTHITKMTELSTLLYGIESAVTHDSKFNFRSVL